MPGLARKIVVCAAVDGLILQPLGQRKDHRSPPPIKIKYGHVAISSLSRDPSPGVSEHNSSFEAFGVVGLITISRHTYLISITQRQQVAQICGSPIYVVTGVAITPCSSFREASSAVSQTAAGLRNQRTPSSDASTDTESGEETGDDPNRRLGDSDDVTDDEQHPVPAAAPSNTRPGARRSSIAQDVIGRRGSYGPFAQRWFSRKGWAMDQKRQMGLTDTAATERPAPGAWPGEDTGKDGPRAGPQASSGATVAEEDTDVPAAGGLLPKLLRATQILLGSSRSFFFSYEHDITRSFANPGAPPSTLLPLHEHADPAFFWNRHMVQPFIGAGADAFALPLMQGFVGQRTFAVGSHPSPIDEGSRDPAELNHLSQSNEPPSATQPEGVVPSDLSPARKQFDITLISRRSVKRAGLRYLRRGVDDEGYAANSVETEQVLSPSPWDPAADVTSFVQIRGSIPLFFTQSPYSLKPAPELRHSAAANLEAMRKHFDRLEKRYGSLQVINLVEKHGTEATIGSAYETNVRRLNHEARAAARVEDGGEGSRADDKIPFEWFDFHSACRGMKFENVSLLMDAVGERLERLGSTVSVGGQITTCQKGVLRTNCMDCLDRTNVCQSSFAKHMLAVQLRERGFDLAAQPDQETTWFNTLWADNGDAISKQYASTAAMKGDYTRTRKRDYRGALLDAGLSLTRFFSGMVNDFFLQATIDFLLGNVTALVFEEFEATMMTQDPAVSMQRMREQAIELCRKRVVADESEEFIGGWTMLTPTAPNTVKAQAFEEAVLLLTDAALYLCRFDWNLDKVSSFERVELAHVQKIRSGAYVTSTISPAQADEVRNVGLVIDYKPGSNDITRINTRSLSSMSGTAGARPGKGLGTDEGSAGAEAPSSFAGLLNRQSPPAPPRKIALKALYATTSLAESSVEEGDGGPQAAGSGTYARPTEAQQVDTIAAEVERLAVLAQPERFEGKSPDEKALVERADIISLEEAKRSTGLLEQLGHSIKKLVWA